MHITGMLVSGKTFPFILMGEKSGPVKSYACKWNMHISDMLVSGMQCILGIYLVVAKIAAPIRRAKKSLLLQWAAILNVYFE
jgi:hypothetical protein